MTGRELERKLRRLARRSGAPFAVDRSRGKGDHWIVFYGNRRTVFPGPGEIAKGTLYAILKQLGLTLDDLR